MENNDLLVLNTKKIMTESVAETVRSVETIDKIRAGQDVAGNTALLRDLCDVMTQGSLCAMGGLTPNPVLSAINQFPEDFQSPVIATG